MLPAIRTLGIFASFLATSYLCSAKEPALNLKLKCPAIASANQPSDFFKITITNTRHENLFLYKDLIYGMTIEVWSAQGRKVQPTFVGDLCPPPPTSPGESPFTVLPPGASLSVFYDRSFAMLGITKPGQYTARALYYYSTENRPSDIGPTLTHNPLRSTKVSFLVQP